MTNVERAGMFRRRWLRPVHRLPGWVGPEMGKKDCPDNSQKLRWYQDIFLPRMPAVDHVNLGDVNGVGIMVGYRQVLRSNLLTNFGNVVHDIVVMMTVGTVVMRMTVMLPWCAL